MEESGGDESLVELERVSRAVWGGKFLILSSQKHGVVDEWTPGPAGLVACGSFRAKESTLSRTNGHGSIDVRVLFLADGDLST